MITLRDLYNPRGYALVEDIGFLYELLRQREGYESISHKKMPSVREHTTFVNRRPYREWYIAEIEKRRVGAVYVTDRSEVGISIDKGQRRQGYGRLALQALRKRHPGKLLANVAPGNEKSHELFRSLGGHVIQVTYEF